MRLSCQKRDRIAARRNAGEKRNMSSHKIVPDFIEYYSSDFPETLSDPNKLGYRTHAMSIKL